MYVNIYVCICLSSEHMCVHIMQYTSIQYYVCAAVHKPHEIRHEILAMSLAISRIASRWSVSA